MDQHHHYHQFQVGLLFSVLVLDVFDVLQVVIPLFVLISQALIFGQVPAKEEGHLVEEEEVDEAFLEAVVVLILDAPVVVFL